MQPSPEDPPELLLGAKAEKPEVLEGGLEEELLEEAGRLESSLHQFAVCRLFVFLLFLTVSHWLSCGT